MPWRVKMCALRALRVGITQSNMSMPRTTASTMSSRPAHAHQVARPIRRQQRLDGFVERRVALVLPVRRPRGRRSRSRRSRSACSASAEPCANVEKYRPARCRTARSDCFRSSNARRERSAQRRLKLHRVAHLLFGRRIRRAFVEDHRDVGIERASGCASILPATGTPSIHRPARRNVTPSSRDLALARQRENLEAAGIGEDRFAPADEAMQPAEFADDVEAGTQPQMERVAEDDFRAEIEQRLRRHAFHRTVGADRHERRRFDRAARAA